jgi:hypothetical protein
VKDSKMVYLFKYAEIENAFSELFAVVVVYL